MNKAKLHKISDYEWRLEPGGGRRVPVVIFASEALLDEMDDKVAEQIGHVAALPGIVGEAAAMPDAHWGYGFPIGGVAAFDAEQEGVVSAGGVGFDISCGVRTLRTGMTASEVLARGEALANALFGRIPAGVGSRGSIVLNSHETDAMLRGGATWAVARGWGRREDLRRIEEEGCMPDADPEAVSPEAKHRQREEMGTLGSGNHYLEVQEVAEVFDPEVARSWGLAKGDALVSFHCGSRGLGHQIGTDYLKRMAADAARRGLHVPDRELACAPIRSPVGQAYLGAMRAAINCALANRQILTHLVRGVFEEVFARGVPLPLLYDVSHNTCKEETWELDGRRRRVFVHRKGATRSLGPGHPDLGPEFRATGQPVLIGGTMGTGSYVLAGTAGREGTATRPWRAFGSAVHGAGRAMSRTQATRRWDGRGVARELAQSGILLRTVSYRGVAEEAPGAYKDVSAVVEAACQAGLARKVVSLKPIIVIKG